MATKRGTVFIAPSALFPTDGRMIDPAVGRFWVSWQTDEAAVEDDEIVGADAAIAWGCDRAGIVLIRLGHRGDTYFSAGAIHDDPEDGEAPLPIWPPTGPPAGGWFTPDDRLHGGELL